MMIYSPNKIRISTLDVVLICTTFYEVTILPHLIFIAYKYIVLAYVALKYFSECGKMKKLLFFVVLYGATTFISTAVNGLTINTTVASFMYAIQIVDIFVVTNRFVRNKGIEPLLNIVFKVFLLYLLITDILMLFVPYNFSDPAEEYFIGNKFIVSYLHFFELCVLFYFGRMPKESSQHLPAIKQTGKLHFRRRILPYVAALYSVMICSKVTCSTGMVICILFVVLMLIPDKAKVVLSDSRLIILVTVIFNVLILGSYGLFTNPYVADFISNVMGKSSTWIGRLHIYEVVIDIILRKPWTGYGYFNDVIAKTLSFGNAQNGVLKILLDSGIIGLVGFGGMTYIGLRKSNKKYGKSVWAFYAFIYAMIAASLVEVNLTHMIVYFVIAVVYANQRITSIEFQ